MAQNQFETGGMATYLVSGKVMPERANVSVTPITLHVDAKDAGITCEATISISVSQVSVVVKTSGEEVDLLTLKNVVESLVRAEVDALGYLWGCGYDIEITSAVDSSGKQVVFGVGIAELEATKSERPLSLDGLWRVMWESQHLRRALGELRQAVRSPADTGFHCYRAIESIRQSFRKEEDGEDRKPSWERLRYALRVDKSWVDHVRRFGDPQRHGATPYMSGEDRVSAMQHAWRVVDRYCVYAHEGFVPLPEDAFPVLEDS